MVTQLSFWPGDDGQVTVQCPHCGWRFDARQQIEQRCADVLDDPRVLALPSPSKQFLIAALPILVASPEPVGPRTLAGEVPYSRNAVSHQLKRLVDFGVMRAEKMREGGQRNRYVLAIS